MRYLTILIPFFVSCSGLGERAQGVVANNNLDILPLNRRFEFTAVQDNNAISLQLERIDSLMLEYRMETVQQWRDSKHETGKVKFEEIRGDSCFIFGRQANDCRLTIMVYSDTLKHDIYTQVERICQDSVNNITITDFSKIWLKGSF